MGLSNWSKFKNIFENAYHAGILDSPLFALDLQSTKSKHLHSTPKILFDKFD